MQFLVDHLQQTPLSTSVLLDHAASLRAVALPDGFADYVDLTVDSLLSSAYRRDGSWYHDPWYTAWALLALREARSVRRFVIEQPKMHSYLETLRATPDQIAASERSQEHAEIVNRWKLLGAVLLTQTALIGLLVVTVVLPDTNRLFSSGLAVTFAGSALALGWRILWPLLRSNPRG